MIGNTLAIVLPLAALLIAGISIAGIWYWWTSSRETDDTQSALPFEPEIAPVREPVLHTAAADDLEGGFFNRLAASFKPVGGGSVPTQPSGLLPAEPPPPDGQATFSAAPPPLPVTPVGDAVEVMRILRDLADGSLMVEINGQRYRRLADITDAQIGRRFIGNAQAVARFARLGDLDIPDDWVEPPANPSVQAVMPPPQVASADAWQAAPPVRPPSPITPSDTGRRVGFFGAARSSNEKEAVPALPMAEQIEELIQYRLTATPELAHRSIHIRSALDGGVRIEVDGISFADVGDISDERIREFIQSTIREWEARQ